jgi:hypothetical protein
MRLSAPRRWDLNALGLKQAREKETATVHVHICIHLHIHLHSQGGDDLAALDL